MAGRLRASRFGEITRSHRAEARAEAGSREARAKADGGPSGTSFATG
jgi:hypothetical protein